MNTSYFIFSLLVGWCGTRWPGWWWPWLKPRPVPDPEPWWQRAGISVVGGLVGGFLVTQFFPHEVSLVTVAIGAFVGGRVIGDVYNIATKSGIENTQG
jgi:hypothetical protein